MMDATKQLLEELTQTDLWRRNETLIVRVELLLSALSTRTRQGHCLFVRHATQTLSMCTSKCQTCGEAFCHCVNVHCCCPEEIETEHEKETTIIFGRLCLRREGSHSLV